MLVVLFIAGLSLIIYGLILSYWALKKNIDSLFIKIKKINIK